MKRFSGVLFGTIVNTEDVQLQDHGTITLNENVESIWEQFHTLFTEFNFAAPLYNSSVPPYTSNI
jgi:hypothetical protein